MSSLCLFSNSLFVLSAHTVFMTRHVPYCNMYNVSDSSAAEGLTALAAAALTLPSPWSLSFRSPGVFGLPEHISCVCQIKSN